MTTGWAYVGALPGATDHVLASNSSIASAIISGEYLPIILIFSIEDLDLVKSIMPRRYNSIAILGEIINGRLRYLHTFMAFPSSVANVELLRSP